MHARMSSTAIQEALTFVPADDRDLWLRIGMAVKSELGDDGFDIFNTWSTGAAAYDAKDAKAVWKSFKPSGPITIATLVAEAKQRGFDPKRCASTVSLSGRDAARIQQEREERDAAAAALLADQQSRAAGNAVRLWTKANCSGSSDYLVRKAVAGYGVRFISKDLLIPMVREDGSLCNVQRVSADGSKRFLAGGRVSGCFHMIGHPMSAAWILVAEGYATAATLHEATGRPVAVAFNEANLRHVATAMRQLYPAAKLLICADDDTETEIKTGKNPGVASAEASARQARGSWCKPVGLPAGKTDFNDLAAALGLEAVRSQIAAAVEQASGAAPDQPSQLSTLHSGVTTSLAPESKTPPESKASPKRERAALGKGSGTSADQSRRSFFTVDEDGVWYHGFDQRGEPMSPVWICSEMHVTAHSRDAGNGDWGYLLEFSDADSNPKRWVMPATMLAGDGTQYRATLLGMGLRIGASVMAKNQLSVYIQTEKVDARVRCTDRIGWHEEVYVMPDRTIGTRADNEHVVFQSSGGVVSQFKQRGTLEEWQRELSAYCRGNSRLLFCVSAAFASTLLPIARVPSGGFHVWGDSSSGKSTAIKAAGSVFGGRDYPRNWRMTDNALETVATQHSDALLILDEIAQVDPKVVGDAVYMLANESGKGRATQTATARRIATWRSMFLSDGEVDLATHMAAAGKGSKAGHDVRMAHVPADAGRGFGIYETLHGFESGAGLSDHLVNAAYRFHGTAGLAFIEYAVKNATDWSEALPAHVTQLASEMCPKDAHGQVSRVAARFALVGMAGELATGAGITGWEPGEASTAARACFTAWLNARGGAGNVEHTTIMRQVSGFFQLHGSSRFVSWHRATDDHAPNVINRAGYRRMLTGEGIAINSNADHHANYGDRIHPVDAACVEYEYFMFLEVFRNEVCKGLDPKVVARLLIERGVLEPETGTKAGATRRERLPGLGLTRCYKFKPGVMAMES